MSSGEASDLHATPGAPITVLDPSPAETASASSTPTSSTAAAVDRASDKLEQGINTDAKLPSAAATDYSDYVVRTNKAHGFSVEVPVEWTSVAVAGGSMVVGPKPGTDVDFPHLIVSNADKASVDTANKSSIALYSANCLAGPARTYTDSRFVGTVQTFTQCGGSTTITYISVHSVGADPQYVVFDMVLADARDSAALAHAVASLTILS